MTMTSESIYKLAALYHFTTFDEPQEVCDILLRICHAHQIIGHLIIAKEGLNGTISASPPHQLDQCLSDILSALPQLTDLWQLKFSFAAAPPFHRLRIRVKAEIVTLGFPEINPGSIETKRGTYVDPKDWNELITDPDVLVLDTRNEYEVELGTFENALDPKTKIFRDFPKFVEEKLDPTKHPRIAMCCTGGVRCEKASAFMLARGFQEVFHLRGGILKYLEDIPAEDSLFRGECFVFDERAAVKEGVQESATYMAFCRSCRHPLDELKEQSTGLYEAGVSCSFCCGWLSEEKKQAARERNHQMQLAAQRKTTHLGSIPCDQLFLSKKKKPAEF